MNVLILAILIIIVAALLCYAVQKAPPLAPFAWVIEVLIIVLAAVIIIDKAGLLT